MMKSEPAGFSSLASQASSMNSLSQAARKKQLHIARNILIFLGVVKLAVNAFFFSNIDANVNAAVQKQVQQAIRQGKMMNAVEIAEAEKKAAFTEKVIWGGAGSLGVVFIFLGLLVKRYPVPMTVLSLLFYLITTAIFAILNPMSLMEVVFKLFAVAVLIKSIHAAIAYQRAEAVLGPSVDPSEAAFRPLPPIRRTVLPTAPVHPAETETPGGKTQANSMVPIALPPQLAGRISENPLELYSKIATSKAAIAFGILGVGSLLIGMLNGSSHWSMFALAPWMLAVGFWFFRPASFRGELNATGLCVENPPTMLPYASIQNLTLAEVAQEPAQPYLLPGPLTLLHEGGVVRIPAFLNVPVSFLYRELFARIPAGGSRDVPAELEPHRQNEEAVFGRQAVFTYCSRGFAKCGPSTGHTQARALLLMLCGLIWLVVGMTLLIVNKDDEFIPWAVIGLILTIVCFLVCLCERSRQGRPKPLPKKHRNAGLVISPSGLSLRQEDLSGFLQWNEVRDVIYQTAHKSFAVSRTDSIVVGLDLVVDGAVIRLADIYDRPLPMINAVIRHFWKSK